MRLTSFLLTSRPKKLYHFLKAKIIILSSNGLAYGFIVVVIVVPAECEDDDDDEDHLDDALLVLDALG